MFTGSNEDPYGNIYHEVIQQNIAINGIHQGIAVELSGEKLIFDNINHQGISWRAWLDSAVEGRTWEDLFAFVQSCGNAFLPAYLPIIQRRAEMEYGEHQRNFQLYRRGRYVEFNLVYDRGTIFGLQTNGRTESILMSLPPLVRWEYGFYPEPGSPEAELYETFLKPQDWVNWSE